MKQHYTQSTYLPDGTQIVRLVVDDLGRIGQATDWKESFGLLKTPFKCRSKSHSFSFATCIKIDRQITRVRNASN